jgi:hypothetical protein
LSWRLYRPRRIGAYEAQIVRRVLQVGANSPPSPALLASIEDLVVREEGGGGFHYDSLDFSTTNERGKIVGWAIGSMANDAPIELLVWAHGETITALELEPFNGTRLPIRMPILESIRPYPVDEVLGDDAEE